MGPYSIFRADDFKRCICDREGSPDECAPASTDSNDGSSGNDSNDGGSGSNDGSSGGSDSNGGSGGDTDSSGGSGGNDDTSGGSGGSTNDSLVQEILSKFGTILTTAKTKFLTPSSK